MLHSKDNLPEMRLELVPVPVSDVDRAKAFYEKAGFRMEVDVRPTATMRVVQFTPPGSACSIVFGTGMGELTEMSPGSVKGLHLVVADIESAQGHELTHAVRAVDRPDVHLGAVVVAGRDHSPGPHLATQDAVGQLHGVDAEQGAAHGRPAPGPHAEQQQRDPSG